MRNCGHQYPTMADAKAAAARKAERSSKPGMWLAGGCRGCGQFHVRYCKPRKAPKPRAAALPKQRTPIKPVSKKRAKENRERRAMVDRLWPERPRCACGCGRLADDLHEILSRARGGSITDPANCVPLARYCHERATNEDPLFYDLGLVVHSWGVAA